jgi:hypothetical protein
LVKENDKEFRKVSSLAGARFSYWDPMNKTGSFELISLTTGSPPGGSDIPPGSTLSGFLFQFDTRIGPVPFTATFVNPADPNEPLIFTGSSETAGYRVYLPLLMG